MKGGSAAGAYITGKLSRCNTYPTAPDVYQCTIVSPFENKYKPRLIVCWNVSTMISSVPLLVILLTTALAATVPHFEIPDEDYVITLDDTNTRDNRMPQKRAALVLDRLLVALQKALHEEGAPRTEVDHDGPRAAPLRYANVESDDMTSLQRRGQAGQRGRVLRCYFNAITCF